MRTHVTLKMILKRYLNLNIFLFVLSMRTLYSSDEQIWIAE